MLYIGKFIIKKWFIFFRDLKPENLLLDSKRKNAYIKVIDFGTSIRFNIKDKSKKLKG